MKDRSEQEEWINTYGSDRLRKALRLGLLEASQGVYRDERVAQVFPGWLAGEGAKYSPPRNPTMRELDVLEHVLTFAPDAVLEKIHRGDRWRPVVTMERMIPELGGGRGGLVKIFTYVHPMDDFEHTGNVPPRLRRFPGEVAPDAS